ncbi:MAG: hypothetical protein WCA22_07865 [Candidatus Binatus sp.]
MTIIAHRSFLEQANTKKSTLPSTISCIKVGQLADPNHAAAKHKWPSVEIQHIADPLVEVTTNAIENLIGTSRRISRDVTRWRSGEMIVRWTAAGLVQAEQNFRRIRGYRHLPLLKRALRVEPSKLDQTEEAA